MNISGRGLTPGYWFYFELTRGFFSTTGNQGRVNDYLVALNAAGQYTTLYNAIDGLTAYEQARALGDLSGESLATTQSLAMDGMIISTQVLLPQIRPADACGRCCSPCPGWDGWITGYGVGGQLNNDGNATTTNVSTGGTIVGLRRPLGYRAAGGVYYNFGHTYGDNATRNASTRIDDHFFGAYLNQQHDGWYWLATGGFGYDHFQTHRNVAIGSVSESPQSKHDGWRSIVYGELGDNYGFGRMQLDPFVAMQYTYLRENGFVEQNGSVTGLDVGGMDFNSLRTHVGARLSRKLPGLGQGRSRVEVRSIWMHELLDETAPIATARFSGAGAGSSFLVQGNGLGRDWYWFGTGWRWTLARNIELYADYDMLLNECETLHTGSGGLTATW